jgi:hypothetical protein
MKLGGLFPYSQQIATNPFPDSQESSPKPQILFLENTFLYYYPLYDISNIIYSDAAKNY